MASDRIDFATVHNDNRINHVLRSRVSPADVLAWLTATSGTKNLNNKGWIAGIDEAGRGPVLGPMVYCICAVPACDEGNQFLKDCGCADSKVLSEQQRESVFTRMCDKVLWVAKVISPVYLSREMLRPTKVSLNAISHDAARELTEIVASNLSPEAFLKQLFVDTVGPPEKYQQKLLEFFPNIDVTVSKKADSLFPVVSAASIIAKIIRDAVLKNWRFEVLTMMPISVANLPSTAAVKRAAEEMEDLTEDAVEKKHETRSHVRDGIKRSKSSAQQSITTTEEELPTLPDVCKADGDEKSNAFLCKTAEDFPPEESALVLVYGSGYPGDPKTKLFLASNCDPVFGFSRLVRFSWQTAQTLMLKSKGGAVLSWPDDIPEDQSWTRPKDAQAGAMDRFIMKQQPITDTGPKNKTKCVAWQEAKYYRQKHLSLVRWPA